MHTREMVSRKVSRDAFCSEKYVTPSRPPTTTQSRVVPLNSPLYHCIRVEKINNKNNNNKLCSFFV